MIPTTMPAAVLRGPGRLDVEDIAVPSLGPDDVLVEVDHCGVCGTDLHLVLQGWGQVGMTPGHEWTGIVAAVGAGSGATWAVGDAVVGGPPVRCGTCRHCAAGRPSLCAGRDTPGTDVFRGAFARYVVAPAAGLLARPPELPSRVAALAEPLSVALHALARGGVGPATRVLVLGGGPIGALAIAAARAAGVEQVGCVEPGAARRQLAADVGATWVAEPDALVVPSIAEPGLVVDGAVDVVLECSGARAAMEAGLAQLERGGTMVLVGAGIDPPRFDPNRILLNELVVTGAYEYGAAGFAPALDLLAGGTLPVDRLLEPGDVPLAGALAAMHRLADGDLAGKVLVRP